MNRTQIFEIFHSFRRSARRSEVLLNSSASQDAKYLRRRHASQSMGGPAWRRPLSAIFSTSKLRLMVSQEFMVDVAEPMWKVKSWARGPQRRAWRMVFVCDSGSAALSS